MHPRTTHALFSIVLLFFQFTGLPAWAQAPAGLQIIIVEGEGAINNVKQRVNLGYGSVDPPPRPHLAPMEHEFLRRGGQFHETIPPGLT